MRCVSVNGGIRWCKQWVNVSSAVIGEYVGLEEIDDGLREVYFGPLKLGRLHERHMQIEDHLSRLKRRVQPIGPDSLSPIRPTAHASDDRSAASARVPDRQYVEVLTPHTVEDEVADSLEMQPPCPWQASGDNFDADTWLLQEQLKCALKILAEARLVRLAGSRATKRQLVRSRVPRAR